MTPTEALEYRKGIIWKLRQERERQGLSRRRIELLGGPTVHCLQAMEGNRGGPTLLTLIRLADVLQFNVELVDRGIKRREHD